MIRERVYIELNEAYRRGGSVIRGIAGVKIKGTDKDYKVRGKEIFTLDFGFHIGLDLEGDIVEVSVKRGENGEIVRYNCDSNNEKRCNVYTSLPKDIRELDIHDILQDRIEEELAQIEIDLS